MSMTRPVRLALLAVLVFAVSGGCGGPTFIVQQYSGPVLPAESISIIRINGKDAIVWDSLDGEAAGMQVPEDSRVHVEVLPGKHTLGIHDAADPAPRPALVSFQAEAGKTYRPAFVKAAAGPAAGRILARVFEVSADGDALLRDVTISDPVKPSPAPPAAVSKPGPPLAPAPLPEEDAAAGSTPSSGEGTVPTDADSGAN
jgi:hypothetical protein